MNLRACFTGLLGLALLAGSAFASNLDKALLTRSGDILEALADEGVRVVGVLPFRVQKGARRASYDAAPLATSIPSRLENALIIGQGSNERKAIGVIRDAVGTAAKAGIGSWSTKRLPYRRLFSTKYKLAWGAGQVKPDALLTGVVINSPTDRLNTTVLIELLTLKSWKDGKPAPKKLVSFKLATDRGVLRDLGYAYALPRAKVRARGVRSRDLNAQAVRQAGREDEGADPQPGADAANSHSPDNIAGMKFEIEYDGVKQEITPLATGANAKQPTFQVPAAKPGQKVIMYLTRVADDDSKLGVVLSVNGKSLFEQQDGEKVTGKKWIYAPGKTARDDFGGFYFRGEGGKLDMRAFKALTAEESAEKISEMGTRAGWIDIDVFVSGAAPRPATGGEADEEPVFSTRGAGRARGRSLKAVQLAIARANNIKLVKPPFARRSAGGLLFMAAEPSETAPYTSDELPNPKEVGGISIRYYEKSSDDSGGKVIE